MRPPARTSTSPSPMCRSRTRSEGAAKKPLRRPCPPKQGGIVAFMLRCAAAFKGSTGSHQFLLAPKCLGVRHGTYQDLEKGLCSFALADLIDDLCTPHHQLYLRAENCCTAFPIHVASPV